jgi:hypothetical protein
MKDPQIRLPDNEWQKTLVRLRDELFVICPSCGRAVMLINTSKSADSKCNGCGSSYSYPKSLNIKKYSVPLFPGKKIYACHTVDANDDYTTVTGEVVMNKNNPSLWGIKNLSSDTWIMTASDGASKDVPPGGGIPIGAGVSVDFKGVKGKIT